MVAGVGAGGRDVEHGRQDGQGQAGAVLGRARERPQEGVADLGEEDFGLGRLPREVEEEVVCGDDGWRSQRGIGRDVN